MNIRDMKIEDGDDLDYIRIKERAHLNAASTKITSINKNVLLYLIDEIPEKCPNCTYDCNFNLWEGEPHKETQDPPIIFNHCLGKQLFLECMMCGWTKDVTPYHLG